MSLPSSAEPRLCACGEPSAYTDHRECRSCYSKYQQAQRRKHIEKRRAYAKSHPHSRPNPVRDRAAVLVRKFGITVVQYDDILRQQGGVCAVCGGLETKARYGVLMALAVDHDHENGKVRGLLCNSCNLAIGKMADNPDRLRAAANYVEAHH